MWDAKLNCNEALTNLAFPCKKKKILSPLNGFTNSFQNLKQLLFGMNLAELSFFFLKRENKSKHTMALKMTITNMQF